MKKFGNHKFTTGALALVLLLQACGPQSGNSFAPIATAVAGDGEALLQQPLNLPPTRQPYEPGELVDYTAQTGDTLVGLASHFNTTIPEIRAANPIIPDDATTMPPGMPMKMPIYYLPLWGTSHQIIPDSLFVYGPQSLKIDTASVLKNAPGWLSKFTEPRPSGNQNSFAIITEVSQHFSVSPMVLTLFLEVIGKGLSDPKLTEPNFIFGYKNQANKGVYMQLVWLANELNNGYYGWRNGTLKEFEFSDGHLERPDPWQNAATVAIQYALSKIVSYDDYQRLVNAGGMDSVYIQHFGDPWQADIPHIEGSLRQPELALPFGPGKVWNYTGGPHAGWGEGEPWAAIDFAPSGVKGCGVSEDWVTAVAAGKVIRSQNGEVLLDLDGDGLEQTGWVIFYLHLSNTDRVPVGKTLQPGDRIGHPSCEGGTSTGTHVHLARKYNGEWMLADSAVPFTLGGWVTKNGSQVYQGTLVKNSKIVRSSSKAEGFSAIEAELPK